jgi:hypothetical protein
MSILFHKKDTHGYEVPSKYDTKFVQVLYEVVRKRGVTFIHTMHILFFYYLIKHEMVI